MLTDDDNGCTFYVPMSCSIVGIQLVFVAMRLVTWYRQHSGFNLLYINHPMLSCDTPTFYHPKTLLRIHHKINIVMSFWPGGDFYALSGTRSQHVPWGYYEFERFGRLGRVGHQSNTTPLAARTNPRSRVSRNASLPGARLASLVTIDESVLDS